MKKGKLKMSGKRGHIKSDEGRVNFKKEMPHIGEGKEFHNEECEYEGNPATKVVIIRTGDVFTVDQEALEERKKKEQKEKEIEEREKIIDELERQSERLKNKQIESGDSFVLDNARVPKDARLCWIEDPDNFSLKLNKFANYDERDKKFKFYNGNRFREPNFGDLFTTRNQLSQRLLNSAKQLYQEHFLSTNTFTPSWRLVVGLGGDSVYETGMTLHHIYGIPYIPASSIKGVLRSWIIQSCFNNNENQALECETFCCVFGTQKKRGSVTFFEALPTSKPKIEPDIMNPHYPEYYAEKSAPVDTDKPNPIFFLTVKDTPFQFIMVSKKIDIENKPLWDGYSLNWWLENALSEHGVGAKTAVGYGYMNRT